MKRKMKVGDAVIFKRLLAEDHIAWNMSEKGFELLKSYYLNKSATVLHIQTHFEDNGHKQYFADVEFANGCVMRGINIKAFEVIDFDWV